ncbi:hypothetical protein DM02DRAFT_353990 [Periconia macrospinosa]|uniref:Uncharacterized protein n=1 Tax=Periconia macrospinosa TaxID=97972 RepID=A0A2V1E9V4_9PLEO|nr:hypothetical protein DM02DRAFT_353990 [Periconia macrospinosa]
MSDINKRDSMDAGISEITKKFADAQITQKDVEGATSQHLVSLTSLPPSVRNRIYSYVLDTELVNVGNPNVSYTHELTNNTLHFKASRPPFPICSSLFYVNKQISEESRLFFYSKNLWVRFEMYTADARHAKNLLEDSGVLFAVAREDVIVRSQQHALDMMLVEKNSNQKRATVMFPAQYLPRLINFMQQASQASSSWTRGHAIFLTLKEVHGTEIASVQGDLLEGFRALTGFSKAVVEGKEIIPGYADGLAESMMAETFDVDTWFNTLNDILSRGEDQKDKKEYKSSIQQCRTAIIALTYGYLTRAELLHSQPEAFHRRVQRLRYNLERTLSASLLAVASPSTNAKPLDWLTTPSISSSTRHHTATALLAAETASSHALSLSTDSPSPSSNPWYRSLPAELIPPNKDAWFTSEEKARAWLELGKAHYSLGECLFAAGDLERADRLLMEEAGLKPGDEVLMATRSEVKMWFERAREGIDWNVRPGSSLRKVALLAKNAHVK